MLRFINIHHKIKNYLVYLKILKKNNILNFKKEYDLRKYFIIYKYIYKYK